MISHNFPLKDLNTFRITATARAFARFASQDQLAEILQNNSEKKILVLGGGSNILFLKDFDGLVIKNECSGIEEVKEDDQHVWIKVGAGESWHGLVEYTLRRHWSGLENLSLIPGNTGAAPIQNIGAYGVELQDVFHSLEAFHLNDQVITNFSANDCAFGYRDSVFKNVYKNQFAILSVVLRLNKREHLNTGYGDIDKELEAMQVKEVTAASVSEAVIRIRSRKLPDPATIGNAGSFFKNPVITQSEHARLLAKYPLLPSYPAPDNKRKVPAAWLIDQCGWKGFRSGDAGVHVNQPLVLVNYGQATGEQICNLAKSIRTNVVEKFGVLLEMEVNVI